MKTGLICTLLICLFANHLVAQKDCTTTAYQQEQLRKDPALAGKRDSIEAFTKKIANSSDYKISKGSGHNVITIPVVVHILYHLPWQNIGVDQVTSQLAALNEAYRRKNADTINTPEFFREVATDCEIEFKLAVSDPNRKNTNGIIRKYTPITMWNADDKMKFSAEQGDDAWDAKSYLNIWVCNLDRVAGYSSLPGDPAGKDGIVIGFSAFGITNTSSGYTMGKTAVHEVGHWLNLKHIWGDSDCGDDLVDDTPKQSIYTVGCPTAIRISCNNGPNGNMYMNYMDFTADACMNMFTIGQKERMRSLFVPGGPRYPILSSTGLTPPLLMEAEVPEMSPTWLHPQVYPNPANSELILDLSYDIRWIGKVITITNLQGQVIKQLQIGSKVQRIDISKLNTGMYLLCISKDKENVREKFVKL